MTKNDKNDELLWVTPWERSWDVANGFLSAVLYAEVYAYENEMIGRTLFDHGILRAYGLGNLFLRRGHAETNESYRQLIPYVLLYDADGRLLRWRRTSGAEGGGEPRLHGKRFVGVGGHLNAGDRTVGDGIDRELEEELVAVIDGTRFRFAFAAKHYNFKPRFLGLLNDESNAVGRVHLGLVYRLDLPAGVHVTTRKGCGFVADGHVDPGNPGGGTADVRAAGDTAGDDGHEHDNDPDGYEGWSQLLLNVLDHLR